MYTWVNMWYSLARRCGKIDFASLVISRNEHRNDKSRRCQGNVRFLEMTSVLVDTYDDQMRVFVGLSQ